MIACSRHEMSGNSRCLLLSPRGSAVMLARRELERCQHVIFIRMLLCAVTGCALRSETPQSRQLRLQFKLVLHEPLLGVDGKEIIVSRVIPPHTVLPWHWHPGEEFFMSSRGLSRCDVGRRPPTAGTTRKIAPRSSIQGKQVSRVQSS